MVPARNASSVHAGNQLKCRSVPVELHDVVIVCVDEVEYKAVIDQGVDLYTWTWQAR